MKRRTGRLFATKHYLNKDNVTVIEGPIVSWENNFWATKKNIFEALKDFEVCREFQSKILKGQKFRLKRIGDQDQASEFELV